VNPQRETVLNDTRAIELGFGRSLLAGDEVWSRGRRLSPLLQHPRRRLSQPSDESDRRRLRICSLTLALGLSFKLFRRAIAQRRVSHFWGSVHAEALKARPFRLIQQRAADGPSVTPIDCRRRSVR